MFLTRTDIDEPWVVANEEIAAAARESGYEVLKVVELEGALDREGTVKALESARKHMISDFASYEALLADALYNAGYRVFSAEVIAGG